MNELDGSFVAVSKCMFLWFVSRSRCLSFKMGLRMLFHLIHLGYPLLILFFIASFATI